MKSYFIIIVLVICLSACVSTATQNISSHKSDHSFTSQKGSCESSTIEQSANYKDSENTGLNPSSISLLNWNTFKGSKKNWGTDLQRLIQGKDIVTLQEALLDEELHKALDIQNLYWALTTAFIYKKSKVGVLTAARVNPNKLCSLSTNEPIIRLPKTLLMSKYPLLGRSDELLVVNIHSVNFTFDIDKYKKQIQTLQKVIQKHQGPMIIAGDFNSWSKQRMQVLKQFRQSLSLTKLPEQNHTRTRVFGNVIDHIFYRGLLPINIETFEVNSSDHNPITVTFSVLSNSIPLSSSNE